MTDRSHGGPRAPLCISRSPLRSPDTKQRRERVHTMSFQEFFAVRWADFLRENFDTPAQIAVAFNVSTVTAQNWLNRTTAPRGHVVARAFRDYPNEARSLLRGDA